MSSLSSALLYTLKRTTLNEKECLGFLLHQEICKIPPILNAAGGAFWVLPFGSASDILYRTLVVKSRICIALLPLLMRA